MIKRVLTYSLITFLLLGVSTAYSEPVVNSVSGTLSHDNTITINGAGFGTKDPAAPLLWDDCEDKTVNSPDTVISEGGYSETMPFAGASNDYLMQYRNIPYRNLPGPHSRSTKYLAGGHEETGVCSGGKPGRDVGVTIAAENTSKTWWANWYVRVDGDWPACESGVNFKNWVTQEGTEAYSGNHCYSGYDTPHQPCNLDEYVYGKPNQEINYNGVVYYPDGDFGPHQFDIHKEKTGAAYGRHANEAINWIKMEVLIAKNEVGEFGERAYADWCSVGNHWMWYIGNPTHVPYWEFSDDEFDPRSFTVGGYYRKALGVGGYWLDDNAFRYFDDIYIDTSLARVILGNKPNYDDITIMEPQIPSAWNENSITCTVNLGRLPASGVAYLFVFDADNNHNSEGYPVNMNYSESRIGTAQLDAPTGLEIVDIEH